MKKVDQTKLAAIRAAVGSISETLKGGTTGGLQNHTDASGDTKMAGQMNSYLDKIAEAVAAAEEQAAADQAANAQQEPEMEMSPEEEELVASLAAQGLDENQIMEVLAGIEEESVMLEEAQEAQADAIVEELSAQGLAPEEILEVVAANAEEEAMAEAQQDQIAAMHGYVPYLDKQAGVWQDTLKRILTPYKAMGTSFRGSGMKNMMSEAAGVPGAVMPFRKKAMGALKTGWQSGDRVGKAAMVAPGVAGVAGLGGAGYAMQPEPAPWYTPEGLRDMLAYNNGYNPYLDKQANAFTQGAGRIGNQAWQGTKALGRNIVPFIGRHPIVPVTAIGIPGLAYAVHNAVEGSRPWAAGTAARLGAGAGSILGTLGGGLINGWEGAGKGAVAGSLLGALGGGAAGYYYPELLETAYKNAGYDQYNPYMDKHAEVDPYALGAGINAGLGGVGLGGMGYSLLRQSNLSAKQRAALTALAAVSGGLLGAGSGALGTWGGGAIGDRFGRGWGTLAGSGLGGVGGAVGAYKNAGYDQYNPYFDALAAYDQYNPYMDKTAANWGALAAPAWGAVKGFGQKAGQFVKGLPGMAAANPWATAGIGAGLATGIGAGAYGLMNQEPSPDEQEFVQWLLNTPEGQQYLAAAVGGLGGAALGAGAGYMAGGGMGAGIGAGLGALGGGYAGYNMPDYTGQY